MTIMVDEEFTGLSGNCSNSKSEIELSTPLNSQPSITPKYIPNASSSTHFITTQNSDSVTKSIIATQNSIPKSNNTKNVPSTKPIIQPETMQNTKPPIIDKPITQESLLQNSKQDIKPNSLVTTKPSSQPTSTGIPKVNSESTNVSKNQSTISYESHSSKEDSKSEITKKPLKPTKQVIYVLCNFFITLAGYGDTGLTSCEQYDIQTSVWKEVKAISNARTKFVAVSTSDEQVFILGGKYMVYCYSI